MDRMQGRKSRGIWTLSGVVAVSSVVAALSAGADEHEHDHASAGGTVVQVVTTNIQGKNVFIPSTIAIEEGEEVTLSIFNTTIFCRRRPWSSRFSTFDSVFVVMNSVR